MKKTAEHNHWDAVWKGDEYANEELRKIKAKVKVDRLLNHIAITNSWKIIDFGCGPGYVSEEIYRRSHCDITCVDSSEVAINMAKKRLESYPVRFVHSDVCTTNLPSGNYDLVVCCGIIEHIHNRDIFISEIYRLLKPGGYLFVVSSNLWSFIWPQRLIKQIFHVWPFGYQINMPVTALRKLVECNGFVVNVNERINDIGDYRFLGKIDNVISKVFSNFGRYIVLVCEKREA